MKLADMMRDTCYWQRLLRFGGYEPGAIDGVHGPETRAAEARWANDAAVALEELGRFDTRSEAMLATLLPATQQVARQWLSLAVPKAKAAGVEVRLICGTRSYAEQDALYRQRPRVTNAKGGQSMHNFGLAFDFGVFRGREYLAESPQYVHLGRLALQLPQLTWGGTWKSLVDTPHIQLNLYPNTAAARRAFEADSGKEPDA